MVSQGAVWPSKNKVNEFSLNVSPLWRFFKQNCHREGDGFMTKIKKQKSNPNSGYILILRINQSSSSKFSPSESVWLQCSGTEKEFIECGTVITVMSYNMTLLHLQRAIQKKWRGKLSSGTVLHDIAWARTAAATKRLLQHFCKCLITHHTVWTWLPLIFISFLAWDAR